jgi:hypothetical protein
MKRDFDKSPHLWWGCIGCSQWSSPWISAKLLKVICPFFVQLKQVRQLRYSDFKIALNDIRPSVSRESKIAWPCAQTGFFFKSEGQRYNSCVCLHLQRVQRISMCWNNEHVLKLRQDAWELYLHLQDLPTSSSSWRECWHLAENSFLWKWVIIWRMLECSLWLQLQF